MPPNSKLFLLASTLLFGSTTVYADHYQRSSNRIQKRVAHSSWPKFHANAQNTAQGQGHGAKNKLKWLFKTHSIITTSPVLSGSGVLYLGSNDKVYALDSASGKQDQKFHFGKKQTSFSNVRCNFETPLITRNGMVIVGSTNSSVYALDGETGSKKWQYAAAGMISTPPAMDANGTIYIGCFAAKLYALGGSTGKVKWIFSTGDMITSAPAVRGDTVYITSRDRHIYAVSARTGRLRWKYTSGPDFRDAFFSSPAVGNDGTVYATCGNGFVYALNGRTGKIIWKTYLGSEPSSPAVGSHGMIYVGAGRLYAIRTDSGKKLWASHVAAGFADPIIASDGTVYAGSSNHKIYAFNGRTGRMKWTFSTRGPIVSCPAIDNHGVIYVGSEDGYLYAIH